VLAANEQNIYLWEVLERAAEFGYKAGTLEAIDNFVLMIRSFTSMLTNKNAYDVAQHVGKQTNLVKELFSDKTTEGLARYENLQELLNSIKEFTEMPDEDGVLESETKSLGNYLQQITLLTDADEKDPNADTVKLMSIHAAKGLEFVCVFAAGLEEMLFPNAMSINTREELEEERRLFYVVITRAKEKLWITYANTRYRFGNLVQNEPSRFIDEIPSEYMDRSFAGGGVRNQGQGFAGSSGSAYDRMNGGGFGSAAQAERKYGPPPGAKKDAKPSYVPPKPYMKTIEHNPGPDFVASDTSALQVGQKVEHQKFGFGEIVGMEGSEHNPIATVKFQYNGEKKIMLNYAKLRIIS
jgi:DNA helicase-2/ATP-dependent DNA helicase PcrA